MADIFAVTEIIDKMSSGFEEKVMSLLDDNRKDAVQAICEQLYSGLDGEGNHLSPTYDNDPYFDQPGYWYGRAAAYKAWKQSITPPVRGSMLDTSPRPVSVPNLFIDGTFYSEIFAERKGDVLSVSVTGSGDSPAIVSKYGDQILNIGDTGIKYFNVEILTPGIWSFFESCGW